MFTLKLLVEVAPQQKKRFLAILLNIFSNLSRSIITSSIILRKGNEKENNKKYQHKQPANRTFKRNSNNRSLTVSNRNPKIERKRSGLYIVGDNIHDGSNQ